MILLHYSTSKAATINTEDTFIMNCLKRKLFLIQLRQNTLLVNTPTHWQPLETM